MSYRLEPHEPIDTGIKRIVHEQIDKALRELRGDTDDDRGEAVHSARKRFKKIRAALRLVRDDVGKTVYKRENVVYRDLGRDLSDVRDAQVLIETVDMLREYFNDQLYARAFEQIRSHLVDHHERLKARHLDQQDRAEKVIAILSEARQRVDDWPIGSGWSAVEGGLHRVYRRGFEGQKTSYDEPSVENFHDWRKRVKYLWYHTRILRDSWKPLLKKYASEVHDLSDYLGDDHDLALLHHTLQTQNLGDATELEALLGLTEKRSDQLRSAAAPLARRLYAEVPDDFVERTKHYWKAWQHEQNLPVVR
ncbi:MAG: CHAD domain-containing protein [Trueperaceae bacterium]|nr:CHAD domain-containing protein [Trueperaceae bacterium]